MASCDRCGRDYHPETSERVWPAYDGQACLVCTAYRDEFGRWP